MARFKQPLLPRHSRMLDIALVGLFLAFVVWVFGYVAEGDYQDGQAEFEHTCEMISSGAWPEDLAPACAGREE